MGMKLIIKSLNEEIKRLKFIILNMETLPITERCFVLEKENKELRSDLLALAIRFDELITNSCTETVKDK